MDKFNIIEKEIQDATNNMVNNFAKDMEQDEQLALNNIGEGDEDGFDQMRNTRTGFGGFGGAGGKKMQAEGNLDGGDDEDEDEDDEDVDIGDDDDGGDQDEDDDDGRNDDF
jgi:hypothetical protein